MPNYIKQYQSILYTNFQFQSISFLDVFSLGDEGPPMDVPRRDFPFAPHQ